MNFDREISRDEKVFLLEAIAYLREWLLMMKIFGDTSEMFVEKCHKLTEEWKQLHSEIGDATSTTGHLTKHTTVDVMDIPPDIQSAIEKRLRDRGVIDKDPDK